MPNLLRPCLRLRQCVGNMWLDAAVKGRLHHTVATHGREQLGQGRGSRELLSLSQRPLLCQSLFFLPMSLTAAGKGSGSGEAEDPTLLKIAVYLQRHCLGKREPCRVYTERLQMCLYSTCLSSTLPSTLFFLPRQEQCVGYVLHMYAVYVLQKKHTV